MRKIAWLMEWSGDLASAELADMQREICRWCRVWPIEQARHILALRASQMSNRFWKDQDFLRRWSQIETTLLKLSLIVSGLASRSHVIRLVGRKVQENSQGLAFKF